MYSIGELRPGMAIIIDNEPNLILAAQHSKQARAGGVVRTKIKNLISGAITNPTFHGNDKLEPADVSYGRAQFLYSDGEGFHFMDGETYEQFTFDAETIDEQSNFLIDGMDVDILYFGERPIGVKLPPKVVLTVTETEPGVKGDTASGGTKPATTDTGFVLAVPLFVSIGDKIRVNTESKEYVERA
jgi:elongation factor P